MSEILNIEVVSDYACPWCYIGKRRLHKALEKVQDIETSVTWRPFQLNPDMPREGKNRPAYYRNKFGDEGYESLLGQLQNVGSEEGIVFDGGADATAPNTLSAHVLTHWATNDNAIDSDALVEKLFYAHHTSLENIGDLKVLVRIADEVGMDGDRILSRLTAGEDENTVTAQIHEYAARGVSGVPFFVINDSQGVSGAQSAEYLASFFEQIAKSQ